jgi:hypothetical protein
MKNLFLIMAFLLITSAAFAQRANNQWSNENVQTVTGTVTDNQRPSGYLKAADGKEYIVHLGPVWYWNDNNYNLLLSDATVTGNVKTVKGEYHLYPFTIEQNGNKFIIADDNGVPKWSFNKSNGNNNGNGRGNCFRNGNGNCCRNGNGNGRGNGNDNGNGRGNGNCWRNN